jgi:hypothetical protein
MRARPFGFVAMRQGLRPVLGVIAAYAVALQTLLPLLGEPAAGTTSFSEWSICAPSRGQNAPTVPTRAHDCMLCTGCCCGAAATPAAATAVSPELGLTPAPAAAIERLLVLLTVPNANRSRGPPAG